MPAIEPVLTTTPRWPDSSGSSPAMAAAASRVALKVPNAFISMVVTNAPMSWSLAPRPTVRPPPTPRPAMLTTTESVPTDWAAAIAVPTSSSTSPPTATTVSPSSLASSAARSPAWSRIATPAPSPTRRRTVAAPSPPAPPVTIADLPARSM